MEGACCASYAEATSGLSQMQGTCVVSLIEAGSSTSQIDAERLLRWPGFVQCYTPGMKSQSRRAGQIRIHKY